MKNKINTESGRSMVEMLGTLAIMGVLSVGAVAGYRYAMDKFNANTILDGISKRAMTASQQRLVGQPINLNEYGVPNIQGYTVAHTNDFDGDTAFFSLTVSDVPKGICDKVIQDKLRTAITMYVGTATEREEVATGDDCPDGESLIEFVFANTLDANADMSNVGNECGYCQHKEGENCVADLECDNGCSGSMPVMDANGACTACLAGVTNAASWLNFSAASAAECGKCPRPGITYVYNEANKQCEPESCPEGYWMSEHFGRCLDCSGNWSAHSLSQEQMNDCLASCPNRVVGQDGWGDACVLPNYCTGPNQVIDSWGNCITCGVDNSYWDPTWGDCALCPGISFSLYDYGDQCVIDCPKNNYGANVGRCCHDNEVYTDIGTRSYGHQYGACCPKTRPFWNGSACVPAS